MSEETKMIRVRLEWVDKCSDCSSLIDDEKHKPHIKMCFTRMLRAVRANEDFTPQDFIIENPSTIPDWCPLKIMSTDEAFEDEYGPDFRRGKE